MNLDHAPTPPDPVVALTGFARMLRAQGVPADTSRLAAAVEAVAHLDATDPTAVYWAGRLTLCAEPDDLARYDTLFEEWFGPAARAGGPPTPPPPPPARAGAVRAARASSQTPPGHDALGEEDELAVAASEAERLRHKDVTQLTTAERAEVNRLVALLAPRAGVRRTHRWQPGRGRRLDLRRTVRGMVRGGEPLRLPTLRRRVRARRLVLLIDVSGSMAPYADLMLRFAHAAVRVRPAGTEVFTVGTRLTRLTPHLRLRDPQEALDAAGRAIPDWSGGTRLGESLRAMLDLWGQRGATRQAVTVLVSDGWERGDVTLLGEQTARLSRLSHRVLWVNPHRGREGFAPVAAGMAAALPHVDELLAGHTFDALQELAEVILHA
ncbi:vWA domain-containing protein [Parafrankia elaeagni]|uniref:vWA domain-containing protein n=1 Tax=Parafrankia elaeagni TaxID=222534 RepID=UPI00036590F7|nr:VWA domain-containing protein [Parafrankia elaeagni]